MTPGELLNRYAPNFDCGANGKVLDDMFFFLYHAAKREEPVTKDELLDKGAKDVQKAAMLEILHAAVMSRRPILPPKMFKVEFIEAVRQDIHTQTGVMPVIPYYPNEHEFAGEFDGSWSP